MTIFIWPTTTRRITSLFRPANKLNHHGIDIGDPGIHQIFAVADGTVIRSYTSTSYGECIIIRHLINGVTWESLYAHMCTGSRRVKEGAKVKQGQVIGLMGSTGDATGQHLHFELHKGIWNSNKTNAVNPLDYLEKDIFPKEGGKKLSGEKPNWANWQWKEAEETFRRAREKGIIHSDEWEKKALSKQLTFDELAFLNLVIKGRVL